MARHFKFKADYQIQTMAVTQSTDPRSGESSTQAHSMPTELYVPKGTLVMEDTQSKMREHGTLDVILPAGLGLRAVSLDLLELASIPEPV